MQNAVQDKIISTLPGMLALLLWAALLGGCVYLSFVMGRPQFGFPGLIFFGFLGTGFFINQPNQVKVLQLFGSYVGTSVDTGLRWANPFYSKRSVSLRVRNFESSKLKVNDLDGAPIEIGAVVVWHVEDASQASFQVDDYESYVHIQTESALRNLATSYAYDQHDGIQISLRSHSHEIAEKLQEEVQGKLHTAGVRVLDARITHLAYAPEIAQAMLQRQQAVWGEHGSLGQ